MNGIAFGATLVTLIGIALGAARVVTGLDAAMAWAIWGAIVAVVIGFEVGRRRRT